MNTYSIWIDFSEGEFDLTWQEWSMSGTLEGLWGYESFIHYQHTLVII